SRRRHTRFSRDWSSDVCSSDLDRDTLLAALDNLISDYDVMTFDTTTSLPDLSGYNTIIVQELSFDDPIVRYLGATARGQIMTWRSEERRVGKGGEIWWGWRSD